MTTDLAGDIAVSLDRRVLTLRFNRPAKKNSISRGMYATLGDQFLRAAQDAQVRVVLLLGHPDSFCAGNDLGEFIAASEEGLRMTERFMTAMVDCPKPIVAGVAGLAIGIGLTILPHCDLVYCGENTRLQAPFVSLGLCPEFGSAYLLPRMAGGARAAEVLLAGEALSAADALSMGLVGRVLPNAEVEAHALKQALRLAQLPSSAVLTTKQLLRRSTETAKRDAMQIEMQEIFRLVKSPEAQEAFAAFVEKRRPDFSRFG